VRLIHLADFGGPYSGSFIPMLRKVIDQADSRGWESELVFSSSAEDRPWRQELVSDGYAHRMAPDLPRRQLAGWIGELLAESDEPTILHTHFTRFDIPCAVACRRRPDAKVVWHFHSPLGSTLLLRARNSFKYRFFGRSVEAVLCVAPDLAEQVIDRGMSRDKVQVFLNAIDTDHFRPPEREDRERARSTVGLSAEDQVVLHFGWDWHRKGGDRLVAGLRALRERGDDSVVAVTVGGAEESGGVPDVLAETPGLRVVGPMEDVALLYAGADLFVSASRKEGQPYSVLEALSSGLPVLASRIPGHELIAEQVPTCHLVDMDDPQALASAIQSVLGRSPAEREREIQAGPEALAASFGLDAWADRLFSRYDQITEAPAG
jgi:glycosyltransferase involved in cell wall biosynthesis